MTLYQRANSNEQVAKLRQHAPPLSLFIVYNSPTQKMPTAFFANDLGNRATANSQQPTANSQQPTANSQQPTAKLYKLVKNHVNQLIALLKSPKIKVSCLLLLFSLFSFIFSFVFVATSRIQTALAYIPSLGGTVQRTDNRLKADITVFTRLKRRCRQKERFL
jgi:hypothetical protein